MWEGSSPKGLRPFLFLLALIHQSAWKGNSPKFAFRGFSELRMAPVLCRVGYCDPLRTGPLRGGCGGETIRLSGGRARPELEGVLAFLPCARHAGFSRAGSRFVTSDYLRAGPSLCPGPIALGTISA